MRRVVQAMAMMHELMTSEVEMIMNVKGLLPVPATHFWCWKVPKKSWNSSQIKSNHIY